MKSYLRVHCNRKKTFCMHAVGGYVQCRGSPFSLLSMWLLRISMCVCHYPVCVVWVWHRVTQASIESDTVEIVVHSHTLRHCRIQRKLFLCRIICLFTFICHFITFIPLGNTQHLFRMLSSFPTSTFLLPRTQCFQMCFNFIEILLRHFSFWLFLFNSQFYFLFQS